ncbi:MAG: SMC-Scp complex subunit ScpB [Candidatus Omnitrophica bacterium]|nr:SMC-Scp complex subunit ScpB [Candidatus Omnitrophota bacterium]
MDDQDLIYVRGVVEALLFVSDKPVVLDQFKEVLGDVDGKTIRQAVDLLKGLYEEQKRGMTIMEIAGGYQLLSNPEYATAIRAFYKTQKKEKLSKPALETLAIIAYKQPVARVDVELIRGVNSDGVVSHLLIKDLIKIVGRKEVPGRPYLYGTTKRFLEYFGLKSLSDLPKLEEFISLDDEKGAEKIEAFQRVSQEFKEDAVLDLPDKGSQDLETSIQQEVLPEVGQSQKQENVESQEQENMEFQQQERLETEDIQEQDEDSQQGQEQGVIASQETIMDGGTDEHPQIT